MDAGAALQLILDAHVLKRVPRTGWVLRGVADAESVADHSYGVALISLVLSELVDQPLDKAKLLTIALLHDLSESVTGDIPSPAGVHFAPGAKREAEARVLQTLLCHFPSADRWQAWWQEYETGASAEGRLVRDADRLDMLVQAHVYERTTGNRCLDEFWSGVEADTFEFAPARALFEALSGLRCRQNEERICPDG